MNMSSFEDLRGNRIEADWVDVKYMTSEIDHVLAHLRHWLKPLPVSTPLVLALRPVGRAGGRGL
jgi:hypothetical protein